MAQATENRDDKDKDKCKAKDNNKAKDKAKDKEKDKEKAKDKYNACLYIEFKACAFQLWLAASCL